MALTADQKRHRATCKVCRGDAELKPQEVIPGRPRDSSAPLKAQPLYFRPKGKK